MHELKRQLVFRLALAAALAAFLFGGIPAAVSGQDIGADTFKQLRYRFVGPAGNRVSAVAGVPGDPNIIYAGAPDGGVFKTIDAGLRWTPVFDDQIALTIGALAVAPSNPNIVWAGTGEPWIRNNARWQPIGDGVYVSTDAGKTWTHAGLEKTGRIARIVVDPVDPNVVFVAAIGHALGPQEERGLFRTKDGGKTWTRVLFADVNTGCSDVAMDPKDHLSLYAGLWQTLGEAGGGPGSNLYVSRNGGETWTKKTGHGLPEPPIGKIGLAIAPSNPNRIYALIETGAGMPRMGKTETSQGRLWVSDDRGENWKLTNMDMIIAGRFPYYGRCAVEPDNPDQVYFLDAAFTFSEDGGKTVRPVGQGWLHGDHHDIWIDPKNANRIIESDDFGVGVSVDRGKTWQAINLPISQIYRVSVDNQIPYNLVGAIQDGPSNLGPSNSRLGARGGIPRGMWTAVGGSEAGHDIFDPVDNNIIWAPGHPAGALDLYNAKTRQIRSVDPWPDETWDIPDVDVKYRFQRTYPIAISPHDHNKVYIGSQFVHQTTDGGNSWKIISPDLTTNDKSKQQYEGGLTNDTSGNEDCVLFAIAESPKKEGVIWTGSNDGQIQVTQDGGGHWTSVTANFPNLPPMGLVTSIEPSRCDAGTCYLTISYHLQNDRNSYVYKTADFGKIWKSISADLPKSVTYSVNARCVREDPVRRGLLYLGTENAIYVSLNDGTNWIPFLSNLPHTPVHWMAIQENFHDLVLATYGRGFWILDDVSPVQQLTSEVANSDAYLFAPRTAYRFQSIEAPVAQLGDPCQGENPPYGASLNYYLKAAAAAPVKISILDGSGKVVRTLEGPKDKGINRVWWDLRSEPSTEIRLRTSPLRTPWIQVGPQGWRPYGGRGGRASLLMPPGTYTVKLSVGGKDLSQTLVVKKDPNTAGTERDIQAQLKLLGEIRDEISSVADMINQLEVVRKQVEDLQTKVASDKGAEPVATAAKEFYKKIIAVEDNLYELSRTGRGSDTYRGPSRLVAKLLYLLRNTEKADFPPTTQQTARNVELKAQVAASQTQCDGLLKTDLPAFNNILQKKNMPAIGATLKTP